MNKVSRPTADKHKISHKENFEFCYLRHQYIRKTNENPTENEMKPYEVISDHMAKNTFFTYKNLFRIIGFEKEDLISIARIHLISFLGLFSLEKMPQKYDEFVAVYKNKNNKKPKKNDILSKNKANCTIFLKQRMEDVVRICRQKARNIKGFATEEFFFFYGPQKPPKFLRNLLENCEKYGFKKLDTAIYKSIKKKVEKTDGPIFRFNGNYYVAVKTEQKTLSLSDFAGAGLDPYDNIHNMTPEQSLYKIEQAVEWDKKREEFKKKSKSYKATVIIKFIEENKENPEFEEEVKTAKRVLERLRGYGFGI